MYFMRLDQLILGILVSIVLHTSVLPSSSTSTTTLVFAMTPTMTTKSNGSTIAVIGLNAALQKRFVIQQSQGDLVPGNVHRASEIQTGVGGKGQDVAIAMDCLQTEGVRLVQFVGKGAEGDTVNQLLIDRLGPTSIQQTSIRVEAPMRTCTSVVGSSTTTELVEPSGQITDSEINRLLQSCENSLASSTKGICIMGSMPPGCHSTLYSEIYQRLTAAAPSISTSTSTSPPLCVMDSVAGVESVLSVVSGPTIYKVNVQELAALVDIPEDGSSSLEKMIPAFLEKFSVNSHLQALAITDGKQTAHLCAFDWEASSASPTWQLFPVEIPKLDTMGKDGIVPTLYPIGAGDAVAAGSLAAWMALQNEEEESNFVSAACKDALIEKSRFFQEEDAIPSKACKPLAAFAFGLACGSASCLQEENSVFDVEDVLRLFNDLDTSLSS